MGELRDKDSDIDYYLETKDSYDVDYYKNNIPNATSNFQKMSLFVHNAVKCFLNHTCQHNLDNKEVDSMEK